MTMGYVHTLGDSSLDNLFWMLGFTPNMQSAKKKSVEGQLQKRIKTDHFTIESGAYDGFTTSSILYGDHIGSVLPPAREKELYMKEKASQGIHAKPLAALEKKILAHPNAPRYVAISVGGNDFRANLFNPWRLLRDIPTIQQRYLQIVEKVKGIQGRSVHPILILQYRTDANNDHYRIYTLFKIIGIAALTIHTIGIALLTAPLWILAGKVSLITGSLLFLLGAAGLHLSQKVIPLSTTKEILLGKKIGMVVFDALMRSFYQPILEYAKKERIPVLDLANTFHPYRKLYTSGIEPNKEGGKLIAEGLHHIIKHHNFTGSSRLYAKHDQKTGYIEKKNIPQTWQVSYPIEVTSNHKAIFTP